MPTLPALLLLGAFAVVVGVGDEVASLTLDALEGHFDGDVRESVALPEDVVSDEEHGVDGPGGARHRHDRGDGGVGDLMRVWNIFHILWIWDSLISNGTWSLFTLLMLIFSEGALT